MAQGLSATELWALLDVDEKSTRKELEVGVLEERAKPIRFTFSEAVYLSTVSTLPVRIAGVEDRRMLLRAIRRALGTGHRPRQSRVPLGTILELNVGRGAKAVGARVEPFMKWKRVRVTEDPTILAGEPVFKRTRLSVRKIGEMLLRDDVDLSAEIREDYPYLTTDDIEFAPKFAKAYPRRGRPREDTP